MGIIWSADQWADLKLDKFRVSRQKNTYGILNRNSNINCKHICKHLYKTTIFKTILTVYIIYKLTDRIITSNLYLISPFLDPTSVSSFTHQYTPGAGRKSGWRSFGGGRGPTRLDVHGPQQWRSDRGGATFGVQVGWHDHKKGPIEDIEKGWKRPEHLYFFWGDGKPVRFSTS